MSDANQQEFQIDQFIFHHIENSHEWQLPFLPPIHLPEYLSLHALMLALGSFFLILIFGVFTKATAHLPSRFTSLMEVFVLYIRDEIAIPSMGEQDGRRMTPLFCTYFFFILILNLMGMIPLFSSATANFNVTAGLALTTFFMMTAGVIYKHGFKRFISAITPAGVPVPILFILVPIEFLGLFIRSFALMIRLFANILAGHIVLLSLIGLIGLLGFYALPSMVLALFISLLEIFVAFLQAYVFTILSALFIGQMYHPEH